MPCSLALFCSVMKTDKLNSLTLQRLQYLQFSTVSESKISEQMNDNETLIGLTFRMKNNDG